MIFPLSHVTTKGPAPGSNNPIRSQDSSPNTSWFHCVLTGILTNQMSRVKGSRLVIFLFDLNSFFALKNNSTEFLLLTWSDKSMDKCDIWVADELDMTTVTVRYWWSKFLSQTQGGNPSAIIYTQWSSRHEALAYPAPMFRENAYREWPEILYADASWPPSELTRLWSCSIDFSNFSTILMIRV